MSCVPLSRGVSRRLETVIEGLGVVTSHLVIKLGHVHTNIKKHGLAIEDFEDAI